jgi:hypothetical protein
MRMRGGAVATLQGGLSSQPVESGVEPPQSKTEGVAPPMGG